MEKRIWFLLCALLCGLLCGCSEKTDPEPTVTPNPLSAYSGTWTAETGDGSVIWTLSEDGQAFVPEQTYDGYRRVGGTGTWRIHDDGTELTVELMEPVKLRIVEEDGYTKLHCPVQNVTLVRTAQRQAAYEAKFVDLTLTDENYGDYFYLEQVPSPTDEHGERIYKQVFVMRSGVYDEGLVFWAEDQVEIEFTYWTTYRLRSNGAPYGVSFYVDNFNSVTAEGTLTFVRSDHIKSYSYDGKTRVVELNCGTVLRESFETFRYGAYLY